MRKPGLLALALLTSWISAFAQTATKPPVHHTVKPVAAPVDPVTSAMKAVIVALTPNEDLGATYIFSSGISDQVDITYSKITTVGCVLSYTRTVDQSSTDKSGAHQITTLVIELKNAVPIQAAPDPGLYRHDADLDMAHSQPFYGFLVKFTIPQPRQDDYTSFNAKGPVPEKHDSESKLSTPFYSNTLENSVHLRDAINNAIQACGGGANVAPPEAVKPPPPLPAPPASNPAPQPPRPPATADETIEWLNQKLSTASKYHYNVYVREHSLVTESYESERIWTDPQGAGGISTWDTIEVPYGSIKSITPSSRCAQFNRCTIVFYGSFLDCNVEHGNKDHIEDPTCKSVSSVEFEIYQNDWASAERFIKAFRRLAELDGATFTNGNVY
jgi:hypothetical protein